MDRIALFLPNWIGDVVMATPAIRAVRAAWPSAELVAVCKPYVADVLAGSPWFRETILFDKRGPRQTRRPPRPRRRRQTPLRAGGRRPRAAAAGRPGPASPRRSVQHGKGQASHPRPAAHP